MNEETLGYEELTRIALGFVLEDENWEKFVRYVKANHVSLRSHNWVARNPIPQLGFWRMAYIINAPEGLVDSCGC